MSRTRIPVAVLVTVLAAIAVFAAIAASPAVAATPTATGTPTTATTTSTAAVTPTATQEQSASGVTQKQAVAAATPEQIAAGEVATPENPTVIANVTIKDLRLPAGSHDIVYDHVTFTGGSSTSAIIELTQACYNITFVDCVIDNGPYNGISINDNLGNIHDITFLRCRVKTQSRMGLECTSRPVSTKAGYYNIKILQCVFEPQGSEAISFDGGPAARNVTVNRTIVQGAGVNRDEIYGAGVEFNGPRLVRFTNNKVYQTRGPLLNLQMHVKQKTGWVFNKNILNAAKRVQKVKMDSRSQVVLAFNVYGGNFRSNTVRAAPPGGSVAYWSGSHGMDWRKTKWLDVRRGLYQKPFLASGSSGNKL